MLPSDPIDVKMSRQKGRVVRKTGTGASVFDLAIYVMLIAIFPFLGSVELFGNISRGTLGFWSIVFFISSCALGLGLAYSVLNMDRLKRIRGISREKNREFVRETARILGWQLRNGNTEFALLTPPWNWSQLNWGRDLVVIYDGSDILVNCVTYGKGKFRSPGHWFSSRRFERVFIEVFEASFEEFEHLKTLRERSTTSTLTPMESHVKKRQTL